MDFVFLNQEEFAIIALSYKVALCCLIINIVPAVLMGYFLARKQFFGKSFVETCVYLPLVLPPVIPGYILLWLFGNRGTIGQYLSALGFELAFNWKGAVLASAVMGFPLMVQSARTAFEMIDMRLENVAKSLGASSIDTFFSISLPLAKTGIFIGAILGFCRSLGEFGATITFVGNIEGQTRTLPLAMYTYMQQVDGEQSMMRLMVFSILVAFLALWFSQWYVKKQKDGHV